MAHGPPVQALNPSKQISTQLLCDGFATGISSRSANPPPHPTPPPVLGRCVSLLSPSCLSTDCRLSALRRDMLMSMPAARCLVSVFTKGSCSLLSCHLPKSELEVRQTRVRAQLTPQHGQRTALPGPSEAWLCKATAPRPENHCFQVNWVKIWPLAIITIQTVNEAKF